jgi:hypothetical protein
MTDAYHNRFGLMGGGCHEPGSTFDRSEVLPFSVLLFDEEEGWQQLGVYPSLAAAHQSAACAAWQYKVEAVVADTNAVLDLAVDDDDDEGPLWEIPKAARR